jgi:hypothetical protein
MKPLSIPPETVVLVPEIEVSDFARTLHFYVEVLGFSVLYDRPERPFAYLTLGAAHIMIEQGGTWEAVQPDRHQGSSSAAASRSMMCRAASMLQRTNLVVASPAASELAMHDRFRGFVIGDRMSPGDHERGRTPSRRSALPRGFWGGGWCGRSSPGRAGPGWSGCKPTRTQGLSSLPIPDPTILMTRRRAVGPHDSGRDRPTLRTGGKTPGRFRRRPT